LSPFIVSVPVSKFLLIDSIVRSLTF